MPHSSSEIDPRCAAVEAFLLGQVEHQRCLDLQERLVHEAATSDDGLIRLLLCEHPNLITVGRSGSPEDIQLAAGPVQSGQIETRWVKRGGGCLVHAPGQLAVYPIVPLAWHDFSLGDYLDRLRAGVMRTLEAVGVGAHLRCRRRAILGRTGQLAALGVAVGDGVAYHGAFINVCPSMGLFRLVDANPSESIPMSCLQAERRGSAKMTLVRAEVVGQLTDALGCDRYHLHTGHPWLR